MSFLGLTGEIWGYEIVIQFASTSTNIDVIPFKPWIPRFRGVTYYLR